MSSHLGSTDTESKPRRHRMYVALVLLLIAYFLIAGLSGLLNPRADAVKKKIEMQNTHEAIGLPR